MRKFIERHFSQFQEAVVRIGGACDGYIIDEPASTEELNQIESTLGRALPQDLKDFALSVSRRIRFDWQLPEGYELPENLNEVFAGRLDYDLSAIPQHEDGRAGWQRECFPNLDDPYDAVWHQKLAFHDVPNGDYLGFDPSGKVVYLSHDDGEGHGYVLAPSFSELLTRWVPLGCPGPEDWQWLPFVSGPDSGIVPDCEAAGEWLLAIGNTP